MKQIEKRIIAFFIITLSLFLILAGFLVKPDGYDAYDILAVRRTVRAVQKEKKNSLDVLILGNSSAYIAYSPMQMWGQYGFTSYNLGTASQRLCDSYALLQQSFRTQHPSVVVLECNSVYNPAGPYEEKNNHSLTFFGHLFPVLHYHSIYKLLRSPKEILKPTRGPAPSEIYKGFTPKRGVRPYKCEENEDQGKIEKVSSESSEYLLAISRLCKEHDAKLQLVVTPAPAEWNKGESKGLKQWAERHDIALLDFNQKGDLKLDWKKDTVDHGFHLNIDGSVKITSCLGKYLKKKYSMPDHRKDSDFSQWQKIYEKLPEYRSAFKGGDRT